MHKREEVEPECRISIQGPERVMDSLKFTVGVKSKILFPA